MGRPKSRCTGVQRPSCSHARDRGGGQGEGTACRKQPAGVGGELSSVRRHSGISHHSVQAALGNPAAAPTGQRPERRISTRRRKVSASTSVPRPETTRSAASTAKAADQAGPPTQFRSEHVAIQAARCAPCHEAFVRQQLNLTCQGACKGFCSPACLPSPHLASLQRLRRRPAGHLAAPLLRAAKYELVEPWMQQGTPATGRQHQGHGMGCPGPGQAGALPSVCAATTSNLLKRAARLWRASATRAVSACSSWSP